MSDRSTAHVVPVPGYITIIRVVQFVLSVVVLGLVGNTISGVNKYYDASRLSNELEPLSFLIFCCVWTWLVIAYLIVTPLALPVAYNMWAQLALEAISWIFWLAGFASTASFASDWAPYFEGSKGKIFGYWASAAAGAAMGALVWILFTVTLVVFSLRLHAYRQDPANAQAGGFGFAEKGESHAMGAVPPQHIQAQQQQPVYPDSAPTPVQYATPPPQQWQQSPPPQQQY